MNNLEYLNQISKTSRPTKRAAAPSGIGKMSTASVIKIVAGGLVLFFLLMMVGALISNAKTKTTDLTKQIYVRTVNLNSVVQTYNKSIKSSKLRSIGISLSGTLTNGGRELAAYLTSKDDSKTALVPKESTAEEEARRTEQLNLYLQNAKLNGILDRTYENQIGLEVSLLLSMISELSERTKDSDLSAILSSYSASLQTVHESFTAFSDPSS